MPVLIGHWPVRNKPVFVCPDAQTHVGSPILESLVYTGCAVGMYSCNRMYYKRVFAHANAQKMRMCARGCTNTRIYVKNVFVRAGSTMMGNGDGPLLCNTNNEFGADKYKFKLKVAVFSKVLGPPVRDTVPHWGPDFQNFCQVAADPLKMQYERAAHFSKLHPTTDLTLQVCGTLL